MINSLFDCSTDNIGLHLKNIFKSGELIEDSVTEKIPATAAEGKNYLTKSSTVRIRTFSFLSLIPQRFSVCGRMFWGRFNNCAWLRLAPYFPLLPHLFRKTKTSDFFEENIRTFDVKHPYFWCKTSVLLPKEVRCFATSGHHCSASSGPQPLSLHKKSFWKISYISYTTPPIILYLLTISGEG